MCAQKSTCSNTALLDDAVYHPYDLVVETVARQAPVLSFRVDCLTACLPVWFGRHMEANMETLCVIQSVIILVLVLRR